MEQKKRRASEQEVPTRYQSRRAFIERDYESEMDEEIQAALKGEYQVQTQKSTIPPAPKPALVREPTPEIAAKPAVPEAPRPGKPVPLQPARKWPRAA